jgi:rhodanese-related sulfurtransferase
MTNVRTLSTDELRQRLDEGKGLQVWNVQTDQFFSGELIPHSRRVSLDTIEGQAAGTAKEAEIVTYCGGPQCPQSQDAARKLMELGYTNVHAYTEGLEGWKAAGHGIIQVPQATTAG